MGDVGWLDLPVPAEPIRRPTYDPDGQRSDYLPHRPERLRVHRAHGHPGRGLEPSAKASVFKYISDDYPKNIGAISGIVSLAGGMGGFVLPIMFGALMDPDGRALQRAFMLMYGVVWVSLIWMLDRSPAHHPHGRQAPATGAA